jgi:hypothetical protein
MMAMLNIPRLNVGLPVWLCTTPNVPNDLDAFQISSLCQGNHTNFNPSPYTSQKFTSPLPPLFGESIATSNQKSKRNKKRKSKKNKSSTSASHVEYKQPVATSHDGGTGLVTTSHTRKTSP